MKRLLLPMLAVGLLWVPVELKAQSAKPTVVSTAPSAVFTSLTGKVQITRKNGEKVEAKLGTKVYEGQKITVPLDGKASLQFFDGSTLDLKAHTEIVITSLKHPSDREKNMRFAVNFGDLLAKVKKLLTPTSSFEVEAGGMVCGVRGTEFEVDYNPQTGQVNLYVIDGNVVTQYQGQQNSWTGGQNAHFPPQQSNNNSTDETIVLEDLDKQFTGGLITNGDNNFTNPSVGGSNQLNVHAHAGGQ